jgi:tetratricopeptide (TPR) repeat protein
VCIIKAWQLIVKWSSCKEGRFVIRSTHLETDGHKLKIRYALWRTGYLACLVLIVALLIGGLGHGWGVLRQAVGVKYLLQAGSGFNEELSNPFVCLREKGNSAQAQIALVNLNDEYLKGVGLCLAGEHEAGLKVLKEADEHSNAKVQYIIGSNATNSQTGVNDIAGMGLDNEDLVAVLKKLSSLPGIEPYSALRVLAHQANTQSETWKLWLKGSSRLEEANDWQAALDWLNEGLEVAPSEVHGSIHLRIGLIYLMKSVPPDYHNALAYYNRALEEGGWLNPDDEAVAHLYRGEVYRSMQDEFTPNLALEEFKYALNLLPENYWALMDIGHVYLYSFKDMELAEKYYRQALASNNANPYAYFYIGEVYQERGDKDTAADWYRQALEHQPDWQPALDRLKALEGK